MLAAAALLLPAIIVLAMWINTQQDEQRRSIEREALDSARKVLALSDAEISASSRVLEVMATSPMLREQDWAGYRQRIQPVIVESPDWNGLVVRDSSTGEVPLEVSETGHIPPEPLPATPGAVSRLTVSGIQPSGRYCPCVMLTVPIDAHYAMTLFLAPEAFQRILAAHAPKASISAIVDRNARFIARSIDFAGRVGTTGSRSLQRSVAKGGDGIYRGVTLEGFENYTAYATSPTTGWSAHIAVGVSAIDKPRTFATAAVAMALLAALVLAAGLSFYAVYELRRRKLEEQRLIGMQKAEAISRFTGMLAHDSRNILAVIDAGVRLILRHTQEEETAKRAKAIGEAVQRGNRLINQLLSFVRGDTADVRVLDLCDCLSACEDLLQRSLGEGIVFRWRVDDDARYARANGDQLELALLNLAINARDAMDAIGTFTISTKRAGDMAEISACDNGPGVPPALRSRIFETFYSTKGDGKGTGLGLAQVAGAARQAGGSVTLGDSPTGGACFTICLPLADPPAD
jgi:signal transduction histidine kinase